MQNLVRFSGLLSVCSSSITSDADTFVSFNGAERTSPENEREAWI
jgi:hypothetical protein